MPTTIHKGTVPILHLPGSANTLTVLSVKGATASANNVWQIQIYDYKPGNKLKEIAGANGPTSKTRYDYRETLTVEAICSASNAANALALWNQLPWPGDDVAIASTSGDTQIAGVATATEWEVQSATKKAQFDEYCMATFELERTEVDLDVAT